MLDIKEVNLDAQELLQYAVENDIIDLPQVKAQIEMSKRLRYLEAHPNKIYQGQDDKWYTYLPDDVKKRKKICKNTREEVEDIVIDYWKEQEVNPTLEELFNEWNNLRLERKKIAPSTYDRYNSAFKRHFQEFGKLRIRTLEPEDVEDFLETEIARLELTSKAYNNLKTTMVGILKRAKRRKLIRFNISDLMDDLDISDHDFKQVIHEDYEEVFDEEETNLMMDYCRNNLDMRNAGILLMFVTGLRIGELVALKHEDIKDNRISVRRTETRYKDPDGSKLIYEIKEFPKTKAGVREVVVPKDYQFLLKVLKSFNPFGEYIFVENGIRFHTNSIRKRQARICKKLEIYHKSPHKVRKTVNTIYMDSNLDNNLIKGQMGWANIAVGENHYHRNRKSIEKKIDIISGISEFQSHS